jgi:hypothetical protein
MRWLYEHLLYALTTIYLKHQMSYLEPTHKIKGVLAYIAAIPGGLGEACIVHQKECPGAAALLLPVSVAMLLVVVPLFFVLCLFLSSMDALVGKTILKRKFRAFMLEV